MSKEALEKIDEVVCLICSEMKGVNTDKVIALAEALGTLLVARAMLTRD